MRRTPLSALTLAATLLLPLAAWTTPLAAQAAPLATPSARVIVKYRSDSPLMQRHAMTPAGQRLLQTRALAQRIGVALTPGRPITDRTHVVFAQGLTSQQLAARLSAQSDVEYAVVDGRKHIVSVPNDSYYAAGPGFTPASAPTLGGPTVGQWYLKTPGAAGTAAHTAPSAINAEQAWDITTGSSSIVVAVIDTGIRRDHADLQGGNVLAGFDMISDAGIANDGQSGGQVGTTNNRDNDPSDTGDYVTQADITNNVTGCAQSDVGTLSSWHGTQTLGLIGAATNNGVGIASVGHGNVKVLPVRALGKCGGFDSDIAAGMYWAAGLTNTATTGIPPNPNPAQVLSMSLGGSGSCDASAKVYTDAIAALTAAKVSIVVAAGNDSTAVAVPANCPGVIAVAGLRSLGDKNGFSSLGPQVTISAPGGNCGNNDGSNASSCIYPIMSTSNSGTTTAVDNAHGGSVYSDAIADPAIGTSFSTPLVAGTVALMLSVQPTMTPAQIKAALQATARPFPTSGNTLVTASPGLCVAPNGSQQVSCYCTTTTCGAGMLDAHAAVLAAAGAQARITVDTASPTAGQAVALSSSSVLATGETIATYQWTITSAGTTGASIAAGAGNASTVSVTPTAAGTFTIQLVITDNTGAQLAASQTVTVAAAPPPPSSGGGGGGGALGAGWLVLLLTAVLVLAADDRARRRAARARVSESPLRSPSRRR